jgi:hypothetical protein
MKIITLSALRALEHRTNNPTYAIRIFDYLNHDSNPWVQPLVLPAHSIVVSYEFQEYDMDSYNRPDVRANYGDEEIDQLQEKAFNEDIARELIYHFMENRAGRLELLVHCNAGWERSPPVAQALNDLFSLSPEYEREKIRKKFIYRVMMKVGRTMV